MDREPERSAAPPPLPRPDTSDRWREGFAAWRDRAADVLATNRAAPWLVAVAAVVFVLLAAQVLLDGSDAPPLETHLPTLEPLAGATVDEATPPEDLIVHVAGAVAAPGLIRLEQGARVADAIDAAGGPAEEADLDRVNLAAIVRDSDRVVVPRIGEPAPSVVTGVAGAEPSPSEPLDLNTATAAELETLPGIGPATAAAIIGHRADHGRFASIAALESVPGIGPAKLERLRELVSVS